MRIGGKRTRPDAPAHLQPRNVGEHPIDENPHHAFQQGQVAGACPPMETDVEVVEPKRRRVLFKFARQQYVNGSHGSLIPLWIGSSHHHMTTG